MIEAAQMQAFFVDDLLFFMSSLFPPLRITFMANYIQHQNALS